MNIESKVAYCGLFCGDCIIRKDRIAKAAKALLDTMRKPEFAKLANGLMKIMPDAFASLNNYRDCIPILETMLHLDCDKLCKEGGGSAGCQIRRCCQDRNLGGCWQCGEVHECSRLHWLKPVHGDANIENINRICDTGMETFLKGPKGW